MIRLDLCNLALDEGDLALHRSYRGASLGDALFHAGRKTDLVVQIGVEEVGEGAVGLQRQGLQHLPVLNAVGHDLTRDLVGGAEGQTLLDQVVGQVGGVDESSLGGLQHILGDGLHGGHHGGGHGQAHLDGVHAVEDALLVLLHILVVGQGDALEGGEEGDEVAVDAARLAADQLGHVGVLLLGHDGGACGVGIRQLHELELPARPQNDLLREAGEVHHHEGAGGDELHREVAVGDAVQRVEDDAVKAQSGGLEAAVGGVGGARQGARADGGEVHAAAHILQAVDVAEEHHGVGHKVVAEGDGLGALEVGIAGHDGGGVCLGLLGQSLDEVADEGNDLVDLVAEVHTDIQGHLVVTASGSVELLAHIPQPLGQHLLHEHMDILAGHVDGEGPRLNIGEDPLQARDEGVSLGLGDDITGGQHGGVGHASRDILAVHTGVEVDGGVEIVGDLIGVAVGAACPHFCHGMKIPFGRMDEK